MHDDVAVIAQRRHADRHTPRVDALIIDSLGRRWAKYLKELRRCKRSLSEESVHDLRVATRRLISTLMLIDIVLPDPRARKLRRRLKRLFDALSPLRDTQVLVLALEQRAAEVPDLGTLITILKVRERNLAGSISGRIRKVDTHMFGRAISFLKKELQTQFTHQDMHDIGMNAMLGAAAARFATAILHKQRVVPGRPRSIHKARVAFKKFRYTVEALAPVLTWTDKQHLKAMDTYQTRMGNIQDMEKLIATVRQFADRRPLAVRRKLSLFQRELALRKKELIAAYISSSDELSGFWKTVPEEEG